MNYYLLFFGLYALGIVPVTLRVELRLGKGFFYRLRLGIAGAGLGKRGGKGLAKGMEDLAEAPGEERDMTEELLGINRATLKTLLSKSLWRIASGMVVQGKIWVYLRSAFPDAAATALFYSAACALQEALRQRGQGPIRWQSQTEISFQGEGTRLHLRGIFVVRLGSLALLAAQALAIYRGAGAEKARRLKEEPYAASH